MPSYPDEPVIIISDENVEPPRPPRLGRWTVAAALLFLAFLLIHNGVPLYTDWLWFGEVGYRNVFTTTVLAKTLLFCVFGALFFALFYLNIRYARRLAPAEADRFLMQSFGPQWGPSIGRGIGWILAAVGVFFSLWAGRMAAEYWMHWLQFLHWTPFHVADPVFGKDVGFYVFRLPFINFVWQFVFYTLLLTTLAVVVIHWADRAIDSFAGLPNVAPGVRAQLLLLGAALTAVGAVGCRLSAYDLLTASNGIFTGAGYTDLHYRLFALNAQALLLGLTAVACLVAIRKGSSLRWPLLGVGAWFAALVILGGIVPAIVEKVYVEPNQFTAEQPYIARNIQYTRQGFGLDSVRVATFPADESLNGAGLSANRDTLENVRLWDYPFLSTIYSQLQTVQNYYKFQQDTLDGGTAHNIDIDRYALGGRPRQVMLAARELDPHGLSPAAQTWQNLRLAYTHGYGLVMSPVNKVVEGGPDYFIQGIPPVIAPEASGLKLAQPDIYYGQLANEYAFVDTEVKEFDYPSTSGNGQGDGQGRYTHYQGRGGIRIGDAPLAKLAFSLRLGDTNVLLARGFKPSTRVLFRRDIRERVQTVAPFLQQDGDPYLVVNPDDGRLVWIIDGYTLSDRYPYSTPVTMEINPVVSESPNYIRNSIKATVDAYDGTVNLYLADPRDPLAQTYAKIFPGLIKPLSAMPSGLHAHLRYPEDLFRIQRSIYATYHVDDPRVFYLREDAWAIPVEPNTEREAAAPGGASRGAQMEPYYVIMRLPEGTDGPGTCDLKEEFLLMSPLAPINRESQNILGWMAARCDGDHYGQLVLYRFPQTASVNGPSQVVALINSDPVISSQLSLLRSGGSAATFGNLLVIPIDRSLLYVAPLYVEATNASSKLPQLQKVVVAFGQRVAMANSLDEALAALFPDYKVANAPTAPPQPQPGTPPKPAPSGPPSAMPPAVRALIERAAAQYDAAQQKLKAGDFAGYGAATQQLKATLDQLRREAGGR